MQQKLSQKEYMTRHDWLGKVICREKCKKYNTNKWYKHNPAFILENDTHKLPLGLWHTNWSPNLGQKTRPYSNQQKKKKKKKRKREISTKTLLENWKKLWNIKVSVKPLMVGVLGNLQGLVKRLEDLDIREQVETIPITVLWKSARILRRVLGT